MKKQTNKTANPANNHFKTPCGCPGLDNSSHYTLEQGFTTWMQRSWIETEAGFAFMCFLQFEAADHKAVMSIMGFLDVQMTILTGNRQHEKTTKSVFS